MKNLFNLIVLTFALSVISCSCPDKELTKMVDHALDVSLSHSLAMYESIRDMESVLPRTTENGELVTSDSHWWTSGFYPGVLWYMYEHHGQEDLRRMAEEMTSRMIGEQFTTDNHDVGFQINCSAGNGYRLTGKPSYRQALLNAAGSLATRFSPAVGCTKSWNARKKRDWQFPVIIDNMMNLELLTRSSALSGDSTHSDMAVRHSDTTLKNHFRSDCSSFHVVDYDSISGLPRKRITHQGYSDGSAWARGQAWALYGYTMMYRETGKDEYLRQAVRIGRFIMDHPRLPEDKVPYWDFDAPDIPDTPRDASAAAIMASAYLELSTLADQASAEDFREMAEQQILSLASPAYLAEPGTNGNFILMHSTGSFPADSEVDAPLTYADYYFVEALIRYKRLTQGKAVVDKIEK